MEYDLIIVGAGPAGIFTAIETLKLHPDKKILILEKGKEINQRICPKRRTHKCVHCNPCNITTGFSGAGAFSDGKLTFSPDIGGKLRDFLSYDKLTELFEYVDKYYLEFGAVPELCGDLNSDVVSKIKKKAIKSNLKLIESKIRHLGTEKSSEVYGKIQNYLLDKGVEISFNNPVNDLIIKDNKIKGVKADKEYFSDKMVICVGREGADWLHKICKKHEIETGVGPVDIGVRVEVRDEIMKEVNEALYEGKFIYYTKTFDDKVRTFCQNPSGVVATEYYEDNLAVVNGHSYKDEKLKTKNTNFALLVSNYFTEPFNDPIKYGKYIAKLGNMLSGDHIIVQKYGDFKRGRRTTDKRLNRNNIIPTLKDAVPGDLSLVLPYRIMLDIKEMLEAMNDIVPGVASDETLLYGVEVKFYSNKVKVTDKFETNINNLFVAGDGPGITRGLMQASANGVLVARNIF